MRNYFTFDGVDSRSFGVYISGQGTFKAPARSYDAIEIPGRNGALLGIDSRLGNVELTYPAFIYSNFAENIAAFRAFLLSHKGYFKLKDSYHPDEFRLAYYPGPFEPDVTSANNAGSFDITFICKPQRYLESGEEVTELIPGQSETHTYTGNPASFVALDGDQITSLQIPLRFYQNLNGFDHPWPAGGGVNVLDDNIKLTAGTYHGLQLSTQNGYEYTLTGTATEGGTIITNIIAIGDAVILPPGTYIGNAGAYELRDAAGNFLKNQYGGTPFTRDEPFYVRRVYLEIVNGRTYNATNFIGLAKGSTALTAFSPYSNICPITGLTGLSVYVGPTQDPDDATVYNAVWSTQAGTVYHGTVDPVTGQLTVDWASVDMGSLSWSRNATYNVMYAYVAGKAKGRGNLICSNYKTAELYYEYLSSGEISGALNNNAINVKDDAYTSAADFKTAMNGVQLVYELATPLTYQLTPVQIAALLAGETFVWSSNNEVVAVEVTSLIPTILENPTLFDALPFLRVYGTGTLGMGSHTITITAADEYTDIDCEMMDCFKGSANKNQYVQFSGNDFPTLEPGVNGFSFSGITKVEVKPRWWSV